MTILQEKKMDTHSKLGLNVDTDDATDFLERAELASQAGSKMI